MATYYKPQSPIKSGKDFIYPITTADQIMKSDNSRRLEQAGLIVADNSTSLGGIAAKDYALKTDTAPNSNKLGGKTLAEIMLDLYPVGAVYISVNSTSPASLFGGTWQILNDVFLLAAGSYANAGTFGGEATHTLTVSEMPSHGHNALKEAPGWGESMTLSPWTPYFKNDAFTDAGSDGYTAKFWTWSVLKGTGDGQPHNNMPPYLAVYMWKRVS